MLLNDKYEYNPRTDLLGTGGFGRVYKASDTLLERYVALKMVNIEGAKAHYSLVEEIKKVVNLEHPNIIRYYDVFILKGTSNTGEETETQVGVMEYIPHGDISQLDWLNLGSEQQKDIIFQILDGLEYLHNNHVIHRDIKPSNILIKRERGCIIPKITDFGISKTQDLSSVSVSRVIGSIPYMAPEQFDSKGRVSYNTDLWSLGILVYWLFKGNLPFGDESTTSEGVIMKNIMEMPLTGEVLDIPFHFRILVTLCLVKDRLQRIRDAAMLKEALSAPIPTGEYVSGSTQERGRTEADKKETKEEETTKIFGEAGKKKGKEEQENLFKERTIIDNHSPDEKDDSDVSQLKGKEVKSEIGLGISIMGFTAIWFFWGYFYDAIFIFAPIFFLVGAILFFRGLVGGFIKFSKKR